MLQNLFSSSTTAIANKLERLSLLIL